MVFLAVKVTGTDVKYDKANKFSFFLLEKMRYLTSRLVTAKRP